MKKIFCCKDLGILCNWECSADSQEELLKKVIDHAKTDHKIKEVNEAIQKKIIESMRETE